MWKLDNWWGRNLCFAKVLPLQIEYNDLARMYYEQSVSLAQKTSFLLLCHSLTNFYPMPQSALLWSQKSQNIGTSLYWNTNPLQYLPTCKVHSLSSSTSQVQHSSTIFLEKLEHFVEERQLLIIRNFPKREVIINSKCHLHQNNLNHTIRLVGSNVLSFSQEERQLCRN